MKVIDLDNVPTFRCMSDREDCVLDAEYALKFRTVGHTRDRGIAISDRVELLCADCAYRIFVGDIVDSGEFTDGGGFTVTVLSKEHFDVPAPEWESEFADYLVSDSSDGDIPCAMYDCEYTACVEVTLRQETVNHIDFERDVTYVWREHYCAKHGSEITVGQFGNPIYGLVSTTTAYIASVVMQF